MVFQDARGKKRYLKIKPIDWTSPSKSKLQKSCKDILRLYWDGDQVGEEVCLPGHMLYVDFININKKIMVEADGDQHRKFNKFFHQENIHNFVRSMERDERKAKIAELNGFQLVRVRSAGELVRFLSSL